MALGFDLGEHLAREAIRAEENQRVAARSPLFLASITAVSGNLVKILPEIADVVTPGEQLLAHSSGVLPQAGARVVCAWINGEPFVLGEVAAPVPDPGVSYRHKDLNIVGRYYDNRNVHGGTLVNVGVNNNQIYAVPFYVGPNGFVADRIGVEVSTGAAGNIRLGAYAMHATLFQPAARIADFGTVSVSTTGNKEITISQAFSASPPYYMIWLALLTDVIPILESIAQNSHLPFMGTSQSGVHYSCYGDFFTYGALPSTFTVDLHDQVGPPRIYMRRA